MFAMLFAAWLVLSGHFDPAARAAHYGRFFALLPFFPLGFARRPI